MANDLLKKARRFADPYRVTDGKKFRLRDVDPDDTGKLNKEDKPAAEAALAEGVAVLASLQERLYAQDCWSVLLIFQALDAAGKDGAIKHVMSGINPQGCQVFTFKAPSSEDLDHDYLWRCLRVLPERGRIGIFNRSYYEEVIAVKVHPELLARQKLPEGLKKQKSLWDRRYEDIRNVEQYLSNNGTKILKFYLHVSKGEQRRRFLERLEKPEKNWKFSSADLTARNSWKDYQEAYEQAIRETAAPHAPWYVVPADNKWFTRIVVAAAVIDALDSLDLAFPEPTAEQMEGIAEARHSLAR
jgi:PPK2 family polyphosphate:nucleotide phosphotransferase